MGKRQLYRSAAQVRTLLEDTFVQLDDQVGDLVKAQAYGGLKEKQQSFSGPAYLDQVEWNAIYLCEGVRSTNAASAHYLCMGEPVVPPGEVQPFVFHISTSQAQRATPFHLRYVRTGDCPGCEVHGDHYHYSGWRYLRQLGDWPRYVEEMEFGYVYFQAMFITAKLLLSALLLNHQVGNIARWVSPAEVLEVIGERVQIRSNLWLGNLEIEMPGLGGVIGREASEFQTMAAPADLALAEQHLNLGLICIQQGRWDDAIREFKASLRIKPNFAEARCNLGVAYERQGRLDEAIRELQMAAQLGFGAAQAWLERIQAGPDVL